MGWGGYLGPQRGLDLLAGPPGPAYAIEACWVLAKIYVKVLALCWVSKVQPGVRLKKLPLPHGELCGVGSTSCSSASTQHPSLMNPAGSANHL